MTQQEVWRERLDDLYFWVAEYAEDYPAILAEVESLPQNRATLEYLELLVPRLKHMQRSLNRVSYDTKGRCFSIANYTSKLYFYFKKKYPADVVITPYTLSISSDVLSDNDRQQLQDKL